MIHAQIKERGYDLVIKSATQLPGTVLAAAAVGLKRGLEYAVGISQREYLQGPRPQHLGEVTTRLRNNVTSKVETFKTFVRGTMGVNVPYGRFHELGFHGVEHVASFNRVITLYTSTGQKIGERFVSASGGKKAASKQKGGAVGFETVKAHDRHVDYAGRPFLSPALQKAQPFIIESINKEISSIGPTTQPSTINPQP